MTTKCLHGTKENRSMIHSIARWMGRAASGCAVVVALAVLLAPSAGAHVTVHPASMPASSGDIELTFRVPNERDNANTVSLQVFFPTNLPLLTVNVLPVPGWTSTVDTQTLTKPLQSSDGPVHQVVKDITWTATSGGIAPGQYQDFSVSAGQAPSQPGSIVFKSLQTYSSGEIVRWIQIASSQNPNPDMPAPVLTLTDPAGPVAPPASASGSDGSDALAITGLAVAVVGLAGVVLLFVRSRRTR
jgi:uncharacterized protein YcnI